jgi:hypothetical protein
MLPPEGTTSIFPPRFVHVDAVYVDVLDHAAQVLADPEPTTS